MFQVAGGCGLGALSAAKQRKVWGIGVDADQSFLGPFVLTSALKRVDEAVFQTIQTVDDARKGASASSSASTRTASGSARSAQKCRRRTWTLSVSVEAHPLRRDHDPDDALAPAGDGGDHHNLMHTGERRLETVSPASILAVEVDVDGSRSSPRSSSRRSAIGRALERLSERRAFDFELPLTAGLLGDERRESDYDHSPLRPTGSARADGATSTHSSPSLGDEDRACARYPMIRIEPVGRRSHDRGRPRCSQPVLEQLPGGAAVGDDGRRAARPA